MIHTIVHERGATAGVQAVFRRPAFMIVHVWNANGVKATRAFTPFALDARITSFQVVRSSCGFLRISLRN